MRDSVLARLFRRLRDGRSSVLLFLMGCYDCSLPIHFFGEMKRKGSSLLLQLRVLDQMPAPPPRVYPG